MVQVTFNFTQILFVPIPVILVILMFKMLMGPFFRWTGKPIEFGSKIYSGHFCHLVIFCELVILALGNFCRLVILGTGHPMFKRWPHSEPRMVFLRNVKFSTFKQSVHSNKYMHAWVKFLPQIQAKSWPHFY